MATQLQFRNGTTSQHSTFTGAVAEVTVDTVKNVIVVHDGVTAGGFPVGCKANADGTISLVKKDGTSAGTINASGLFNNTLTSTNNNQALTAAQGKVLKDLIDAASLGVNQTYQDVTALRVSGTTYINTTGKPIFLTIMSTTTGSTSSEITITVDGQIVAENVTRNDSARKVAFGCAIIQNEQNYSMTWDGTPTIKELK